MFLKFKFKYFLILLLVFITKSTLSEECSIKEEIKIGLIESNYIDYKYYLYYTLGEFSKRNKVNFKINQVNHNADEFDIIFGEYRDLKKLSINKNKIPNNLANFYRNNEIEVSDNIFPLDLDTFILLSHDNKIQLSLEELIDEYSPLKYSLGLSFLSSDDMINLLVYQIEKNSISLNSLSFELSINLFNKIYKNINKNILYSNYLDIYNSYENYENIFTLFSDGVLLYKNLDYNSFQLFPKSHYTWNEEKGYFKKILNQNPISFYGFSAYVNNSDNIGFLCYLIEEDVRLKTFEDFNVQISPLSMNELVNINQLISDDYKTILENKNKFIFNPNYELEYDNLEIVKDVLFNQDRNYDMFDSTNYLN